MLTALAAVLALLAAVVLLSLAWRWSQGTDPAAQRAAGAFGLAGGVCSFATIGIAISGISTPPGVVAAVVAVVAVVAGVVTGLLQRRRA